VPTTGGHSLFASAELEQVLTGVGVGAAVDAAGRLVHRALRRRGLHRGAPIGPTCRSD
jgi:hypothetical protein